MFRYPVLALAALLGIAPLALAQAPQPQTGFFPPKAGDDPSLTHTLPPETYPSVPAPATPVPPSAAPVPAPAPAPAPMPAAAPPPAPPPGMATTTVTTTGPQPAAVESSMDRAEAEARRAQEAAARAPQRINGSFTGLTDERDR